MELDDLIAKSKANREKIRKVAPEHADMMEMLKDQLLIVFLRRLVGENGFLEIPATEIDDTGKFNLSFSVPDGKTFHFDPVDYDARELAGGKPITPDHREIDPATGQQKGYVVLSAAERAKRWVRPYRDKYLHIGKRIEGMDYRVITPEKLKKIVEVGGCATHTSMSRDIAETYSRAPSFYSKTFCCNCRDHFLLSEFVWLGTNEEVGS